MQENKKLVDKLLKPVLLICGVIIVICIAVILLVGNSNVVKKYVANVDKYLVENGLSDVMSVQHDGESNITLNYSPPEMPEIVATLQVGYDEDAMTQYNNLERDFIGFGDSLLQVMNDVDLHDMTLTQSIFSDSSRTEAVFVRVGNVTTYKAPCLSLLSESERLDAMTALIESLTTDFEYSNVEYQDGLYTLRCTHANAAIVASATTLTPSANAAWDETKSAALSWCDSIVGLLDAFGISADVEIRVLNDLNLDNVLLLVRNGEILYDYAETL